MNKPEYKITFSSETERRVGYSSKANELFIYWFEDDLIWAVGESGANVGFADLVVWDNQVFDLGKL